ncbi:MAG: fumarylacetoacetate hydrolase family protein [Labilithrix sp.]|nr:fumarylacetoacetate hydrolase family protein [Labilithrix sp.]
MSASSSELISAVAGELAEARRARRPIAPVRGRLGERAVDAAYAVQRLGVDRAVSSGDRVVGRKIGLTSVAVQEQLGVAEPDFGTLLASMELASGDVVPAALIQPKAEAEIAFVLGRDLTGERPTFTEVVAAIDFASPAVEIVDSAIAGWDIGVVDTVADNASSALYVLGAERRAPHDVDLRLAGMVLEKNGAPASFGAGAACLGHPLRAVTWLARTMVARGTPLRAGDVVLSGALGPMVAAAPGDRFEARIEGVGRVAVSFARDESKGAAA